MKKLIAICIFCVFGLNLNAQFYGNTWINYSQKYYKFPIFKEGIYRIDAQTLGNTFNLAGVNPKNFQLFLKGKEQFVYFNGDADGTVDPGDYLEFYANPLMGELDSTIYTSIQYLPNPYLPLFNDTIYAFLTINNSINNKRYTLETDTNSAAYPAGNYFYSEKVYVNKNAYNLVNEYINDGTDPRHTQAEGYGTSFVKGQSITTNFGSLNTFTSSPLPCYVSLNYSGSSFASSPDHQIQTSYSDQLGANVIVKDTLFTGFVPVRQTFTFSSQNTNNNTGIAVSSVASPSFSAFDNSTILSYINFLYPQTLNLNNQSTYKLFVDNNPSFQKTFFDFSNFNFAGASEVLLYDLTNGKKISAVKNAPMLRAVIPNGSGRKICFMAAETQTINIPVLTPVNQNGSFKNFKTPTSSKPFVIIHHKATAAGAELYQNYRETTTGGSYNVINADVDELFEQFAYGVNKHPVAIRNFIRFLKDSLSFPPAYIFLIGKAINYVDMGAGSYTLNMIPTIGIPSSDMLLAAGLSPTNTLLYPEIPIGRIAALTNTDVFNYLEKIQTHENSVPAEWKKRVLHFVGGDDVVLNQELSGYMSNYEQIIKDTLFGANVLTFKKNTTQPIQVTIADSLKNALRNGAALINFFGHGSEQGFDQAVDDPEDYDNKGKYSFIIANACYSGNIHIPGRRSVSEKFVFSKEKGSIGFLAATSVGYTYALDRYTSKFYRALGITYYNKGIGDIIRETVTQNAASPDPITLFTGLDMTLHGDPSLKISNGALPDYIIKNSDVSFDLKKYTDSIGVKINLLNLGSARSHSIDIKVERYYPNGDSDIVVKRRLAPFFKDSLLFYSLIDFNRGIGLNKYKVKVDAFNEIGESHEDNNTTMGTVDVFIPGGDILPVYPYKYAIVEKTNTITLKASTTDPFAPQNTYRFQLDTCDKFTSPIQSTAITSKGGVIEWVVNLPFKDSTVYFWRVSKDSVSPLNSFIWKETSFQTIGDKRGWGQAHFNQFKNNGYRFVSYRKDLRLFIFANNKQSISCRNGLYPETDFHNINYFFNNLKMSTFGCAFNGWTFAVFDSISGEPQVENTNNVPGEEPGIYNNCHCVDEPLYYFSFGQYGLGNNGGCGVTNWKLDIENFLNSVAPNNYILGYTNGDIGNINAAVSTYNNSLYNAFESFGAVTIRNTLDTVPYILFGRKGMTAGQGHELKGVNRSSLIVLNDSIQTRWNTGYIASEVIGPAFKWNSLHWRVKSLDPVSLTHSGIGDKTILKLVGIKLGGQIDTLVTFPEDSMDVLALGNYADAAIYPNLKLVAYMSDNIHTTSPQLKRWQILYDEAPECAINPLKGFESLNANLQEGDLVAFKFPIENIGVKKFRDSLLITYWIENESHNKISLPQKMKAPPFQPGQVIFDTIKASSYQLTGNNSLWIYVNPFGNLKYQNEQYQFNNIARYTFTVTRDITNPLLDVTFDGIRILNGDIVSAKPNILITLKDENRFLELNDTSAFTISIQAPGQPTAQRIYFGQGLQFTPANLPKNSCAINYNPNLLVDGKYTLNVQAKDRSNNRSAAQMYKIDFEINNKPTVTNVLNYPNPFSTSTKFVFTLTGSEVPEIFTIQIITITGKLIREITRAELGNLHIGRNITDFTWDGRDEYGDKLANGVYLYKVVTKLNGESIEKSGTNADKFFTKEFGKMVIMR